MTGNAAYRYWQPHQPLQTLRNAWIGVGLLLLALAGSIAAPPLSAGERAGSELPVGELRIAGKTLTVEIAATPDTMARGLMFREYLPEDHAMLFVWPQDQTVGMWMKNTLIPLSVAFIDRDYRVRNIADMDPLSLRLHPSRGPVRYALEVNRGWFERHGIRPGSRIEGLPDLLVHLHAAPD